MKAPNPEELMISFIKKKHEGQFYTLQVPKWVHTSRVALLVQEGLATHKEASPLEREAMVLAAYGHDLLEDTSATKEEIQKMWGETVANYVEGMTNHLGDTQVSAYVQKITSEPEEVRIIKCADLCDNMLNVAYTLPTHTTEWVRSYFLPIVLPMSEAITQTSFLKYRKTGQEFKNFVQRAHATLLAAIKFRSEYQTEKGLR